MKTEIKFIAPSNHFICQGCKKRFPIKEMFLNQLTKTDAYDLLELSIFCKDCEGDISED